MNQPIPEKHGQDADGFRLDRLLFVWPRQTSNLGEGGGERLVSIGVAGWQGHLGKGSRAGAWAGGLAN